MESQNNLLDTIQAIERFPKPGEKGYRQGVVIKFQPGTTDTVISTMMGKLETIEAGDVVLNKGDGDEEVSIAIYIHEEQTTIFRRVMLVLTGNEPGSPIAEQGDLDLGVVRVSQGFRGGMEG